MPALPSTVPSALLLSVQSVLWRSGTTAAGSGGPAPASPSAAVPLYCSDLNDKCFEDAFCVLQIC